MFAVMGIRFSYLVIINDFNVGWPRRFIGPFKTHSPLVIDPYAVLTFAFSFQRLKSMQQDPTLKSRLQDDLVSYVFQFNVFSVETHQDIIVHVLHGQVDLLEVRGFQQVAKLLGLGLKMCV